MSIAFFIEKGLTKTEAETATLFCEGMGIIGVCVQRNMAIQTVKMHWTSMKRKLKVENRVQLANLVEDKIEEIEKLKIKLEKRMDAMEKKLDKLLLQNELPKGKI